MILYFAYFGRSDLLIFSFPFVKCSASEKCDGTLFIQFSYLYVIVAGLVFS